MMKILMNLIQKQLTEKLNLKITGSSFSFDSSLNTRVYGSLFFAKKSRNNICIVMYHGLGAHTHTQGYIDLAHMWTEQGYDVIGMDIRHQGGLTTGHPKVSKNGLYTSGYESLETYYYTQIYIDTYLLLEVAKQIFPNHLLIANGGSQGGALALISAALHPDIALCIADMPSNTDIPYLMHHSDSRFKDFNLLITLNPSQKTHIENILIDIDVLSYAKMIKVPTLLASGSNDQVCPTITTSKLYDLLTCKKDFCIYEGFGHGGYDDIHFPKKLEFIHHHLTHISK